MGKKQHSKDRMFLTKTEWATEWGGAKSKEVVPFKRLPYYCCSLTFTPFQDPVCTIDGSVFDILHIMPYIKKYGKHPVTGVPLKPQDLIPLTFHKNSDEESGDAKAAPSVYLQKLREIQSYQGNPAQVIGIGLEGHFRIANIPYMRAGIDTLAATGMPIWLTEVSVDQSPNQVQYLEEILREAHSHPAVQGIVLWTAWHPGKCYKLCLTDNNFRNLPAGDVVDKLIQEWKTHGVGITDSNGIFETSLFHGDYNVTISHPMTNSSSAQSFKVAAAESSQETTLHVQISNI